ncbi:DUF418 domain-containing protein [Lysinibacter sp. HNR]|uniref:DUF418 domain-containing protein n=1 Tax=Lysinibacter sp. HNR TaxID=3031408 RepID=UPI0024348378|nr:DUF418 domain-containing protein [Lysinibacter sp. HNR]WGD37936.1 DUF418 domain-containing protein [Lysinibacter sp. HNR]
MRQNPDVSQTPRTAPGRYVRYFRNKNRIVGLDMARGLAVLGMLAAHLLIFEDFNWGDPGTWGDVVNGRSSVLFAVLAGISVAIISGRTRAVSGVPLLQARLRIFTRAVVIIAIGGILETLGTPIAIILPVYGMLFIASLPFLRWRPSSVFGMAASLALIGPLATNILISLYLEDAYSWSFFADLVVLGEYPGLIWIVFVLLGLGVGRLDLGDLRVQRRLLIVGVSLAVGGYGTGAILWGVIQDPMFSIEPHSGSTFEVVGASGFALAIIGLCLLVPARARPVLYPLAATGAMALTSYTLQIVVMSAVGYTRTGESATLFFVVLAGVTLMLCSLWIQVLGRGPLEWMLTSVSNRAARAKDSTLEQAPAGHTFSSSS